MVISVLLLGWGWLGDRAAGQQWSGALSLSSTAGYQTNPYLDPLVGEWNPGTTPEFAALDPAVGIRYTRPTLQLNLSTQARTYLGRLGQSALPLLRLSTGGQYTLASAWRVGMQSGVSRYRSGIQRDTWWAFPSLQWHPDDRTSLTLRAGWAGRERNNTARQTSGVGLLEARRWLTDEWQGTLSAYVSNSRMAQSAMTYGGTGLTLSTTYWWTPRLALRGYATLEQIRYDILEPPNEGPSPSIGAPTDDATETQPTTVTDRLWRGGAEMNWTVQDHLTLFARTGVMHANVRSSTSPSVDVHVSAGLRWSLSRTLSGRETIRSQGPWRNVDDGLRFDVRYAGDGQVFVTGDFNDWASPGIPLHATESNRYEVTLSLPPGRYEYRIRVVENSTARWLDLPTTARTVRDGFGGVNGVCIVE